MRPSPPAALAGLEIGPAGERPLSGLAAIEYPPVASVFLGFRREQVVHPLDGFGALVPATERPIDPRRCFFLQPFPGRVPRGPRRAHGPGRRSLQPEIAQLSADKLVSTGCARTWASLLGAQGRPVFTWHTLWPRAIPQYNLGYGLPPRGDGAMRDGTIRDFSSAEASATAFRFPIASSRATRWLGGLSLSECLDSPGYAFTLPDPFFRLAQDLKDTLQLPRTDFPMRAGLAQREPARVAHWEKTGLYEAIQRKRAGAPAFVLHDGPPFTNGDVHIGTALNKTLKDIIVRYKAMRGFRTPYVPGWDCHGLPIEQKVDPRAARGESARSRPPSCAQLCDAFSEAWIAKQRDQFKRLGVLADWANEYKTKAPAFEADILRIFAAFVEKGLVYRSKKPVYWSIPFETALAEAEIEYKEHSSPSIWVRFQVPAAEAARFGLPGRQAAQHRHLDDDALDDPGQPGHRAQSRRRVRRRRHWAPSAIIVAAALPRPRSPTAAGLKAPPAVGRRRSRDARSRSSHARHPFIDRASPVVLADYVTTDSGTGAVHTAPGHGAEDYQTGLGTASRSTARSADNGTYLDDGRIPADLVGVTTLESVEDLEKKKTSPANVAVLQQARRRGRAPRQEEVHPQLSPLLALQDADHLPRGRPVVRRPRQGGLARPGALAEISRIAAAGRLDPRLGRGPHPRRGRVAPRLVHQPPALLGRADPRVLRRRQAPLPRRRRHPRRRRQGREARDQPLV